MDPIASERALAYAEPAIYPSRDFVTVQAVDRPTDFGRFYGPNQRISITIKSPGQNEFFDADKMRLEFSVLSVVDPPTRNFFASPLTASRHTESCGLPMSNKSDVCSVLPGIPSWGLPFFSAVRVSVPGLPLESFLTSDGESQWMAATRLMCASGTPDIDRDVGPHSFGIRGEAEAAGARSILDRAACVQVNEMTTDRTRYLSGVWLGNNIGTDIIANPPGDQILGTSYDTTTERPGVHEGVVSIRGTPIHYSVPLSMFSHLFNMPSNLLPLGFYSSSADTVTFTFETAPASSAVTNVGVDRPDMAGPATYYIIDPEIRYSKLQISNPQVLASIEALYRGVAQVPVAPGLNIPLACVMKFINYGSATQRISAPSGFFNVSIPANQPSMRAIAIRFCGEGVVRAGMYTGVVPASNEEGAGVTRNYATPFSWPLDVNTSPTPEPDQVAFQNGLAGVPTGTDWKQYSAGDGQWGGRYLLSVRPFLRNVILRIASFRIPLDALFDLSYPSDQNPRGLSTNPWQNANQPEVGQPFNSSNPTFNPIDLSVTTNRNALRLYKQGKHLFSPFAVHEDPYEAPLAPLYMTPNYRVDGANGTLLQGYTMPKTPSIPVAAIPTSMAFQSTIKVMSGGGFMRFYGMSDNGYLNAPAGGGNTKATPPKPMVHGGVNRPKIALPYWAGPNLLILPLETIGAVYNHKDDAFAIRGLDLRSIGSMELSGEIVRTAHPDGPGCVYSGQKGEWYRRANYPQAAQDTQGAYPFDKPVPTDTAAHDAGGDDVQAQSWTVRVLSAFDQEHVLLPGRTDTEAQFSLIPTGASAIPSGGAPAM